MDEVELGCSISTNYGYVSGLHCYVNKTDACSNTFNGVVIRCYAKSKDITAMGEQGGVTVVVTKQLLIKSFRKVNKT